MLKSFPIQLQYPYPMRGKSTFSRCKADKSRELLIRIGNVPDRPNTHLRLRMLMQKRYGFYISDFDSDTDGKSFAETKFDALVEAGQITALDLDFDDVSCSRRSRF